MTTEKQKRRRCCHRARKKRCLKIGKWPLFDSEDDIATNRFVGFVCDKHKKLYREF